MAAIFLGCSPEFGHKIMAALFDSVADADKAEMKAKQDTLATVDSSAVQIVAENAFINNYSLHEPYKARECESCHNTADMTKLNEVQPALCYMCHSDFSEQYAHLHGPVEGGFCTECHNPHIAKNKKLLENNGQDLCLKCHYKEDVLRNEMHDGIGETDCAECHNPHGGEDKFILR